jgi:hypothetical protein
MTVRAVIGQVLMLDEKAADAVRGGSDAATVVLRTKASDTEILGLTITREWFQVATLSLDRSNLRIIVSADPDHRLAEPVGWGFTFDFAGSPPRTGRADPMDWARRRALMPRSATGTIMERRKHRAAGSTARDGSH